MPKLVIEVTDPELKDIIKKLRDFTLSERQKNPTKTMDLFFINAIEMACNLTELGLIQKREISKEERYWFQGGYHMNFWDPDIETNLYSPLVDEVTKRKWFK